MHSSRMRTARSSCHPGGGLHIPLPDQEPPGADTPQVWAWRPPWPDPLNFSLGCGPGDLPSGQIPLNFPLGCGLGDLPGHIPLNFPIGCGPGNLQGMLGYHLPGDLLQMHAGIPPAMYAGIPPPKQNYRCL